MQTEEQKQKNSEYQREYRIVNRDAIREQRKQFRLNNKEIQQVKTWREKNPERSREINKQCSRKHPEIYRMLGERRRARKRFAPGASYTTAEHIVSRRMMWGNKCWVCGREATATDHVKPLAKNGSHFPANLRPICHSCNSKKSGTWNGVARCIQWAKEARSVCRES